MYKLCLLLWLTYVTSCMLFIWITGLSLDININNDNHSKSEYLLQPPCSPCKSHHVFPLADWWGQAVRVSADRELLCYSLRKSIRSVFQSVPKCLLWKTSRSDDLYTSSVTAVIHSDEQTENGNLTLQFPILASFSFCFYGLQLYWLDLCCPHVAKKTPCKYEYLSF